MAEPANSSPLRLSSFLVAALAVLRSEGKPLGVRQIVELALERGILASKGRTPVPTMRARLSEELRRPILADSPFQRVGANRFALREWGLLEYHAPKFQKEIPAEQLVCINKVDRDRFGSAAFVAATGDNEPVLGGEPVVVPRRVAEGTDEFSQLVAYVLITDADGSILAYTRGSYSAAHPMLRGSLCIGWGGHVRDSDERDLFGYGSQGLRRAAHREVSEELQGAQLSTLRYCGLINDNTSTEGMKHLCFVFHGVLGRGHRPNGRRKERAVNSVSVLSSADLWNRYHELEYWSQLVLCNVVGNKPAQRLARVHPPQKPYRSKTLVIVGEIASGKTTLADALCVNHGFAKVSTRQSVARLIGLSDFGTDDRNVFQERAARLVASKDGCRRLAEAIAEDAAKFEGHVVIDGVRQLETLRHLRDLLTKPVVVYVDSPRNLALSRYVARSGDVADAAQFRREREHSVESEVTSMRFEADAHVFNGGSEAELLAAFTEWWK